MTMLSIENSYDIAIIGGGMVGASLACSLACRLEKYACNQRMKIIVLEAFDDSGLALQPSYDARSTAISYGSKCIFERISCWQELKDNASPIDKIHISDKGHFGTVLLDCDEYQQEAFGYVLENGQLGKALLAQIKKNSETIHWLNPALVESLTVKQTGSVLTINYKQEKYRIQAGLVVVADGGRSSLCQSLGIDYQRSSYQQSAIITNVSTDKNHHNQAYERFTLQGPMALLPLKSWESVGSKHHQSVQQKRFSLVWTVPQDNSSELMKWTDEEFIRELQMQFGYRAGQFLKIGKRYVYPLNLISATEQIRPGIVILGNAAHTLHPVAGQSFNLALRNVAALTDVLCEAISKGQLPGDINVLNAYVKRQKQDQITTLLFSDYLVKLFTSNSRTLSLVRKFGMLAIDLFSTVQTDFNAMAAGKYFRESRIL